jgi:hypothetical protein
MKLSSTDGTQKTIEDLNKAWSLLHSCYLRIQEINDGTYNSRLNPPIQFDCTTCTELSNWMDKINDITKKINEIVCKE